MTNTAKKEFSIQKIFTDKVRYHAPNTPAVFSKNWHPDISLNLGLRSSELEESMFILAIDVEVVAKSDDKLAYEVEVTQKGIFLLEGFSENESNLTLGTMCPSILFPFTREIVQNLVSKGGFPQLLLAPVNFETLYEQKISAPIPANELN